MRVEITESKIFIDLGGVEVHKCHDWINDKIDPAYITVWSRNHTTDDQARQLINKLSNARTLVSLLDSAIKNSDDIGRIVVKTDPNDSGVCGVSFFDDSLSESDRLELIVPVGTTVYSVNEQAVARAAMAVLDGIDTASGTTKWIGGVYAPNGKIYSVVNSTVIEIDPDEHSAPGEVA